MLFNLFGGKKEEKPAYSFNDITYVSLQAKCDAIAECLAKNPYAIGIAWFAETASKFKALFSAAGLDEERIIEARSYSALKYPDKQIIFLEHYPLHEKERDFVQHLQQKGFTVYNSLTDPLIWTFGGERLVALMKKMGMKEDEPISHNMVSSSIRKAQEKLASSVTVEQSGASQAEWFKRNFPGK